MPQIVRLISLLLLAKLTLPLSAALPELSSTEPIEYDEATKRLIAHGDAILEFENTRIQADQVNYHQDSSLADALGNVSIMRDGYRAVANRLSYDGQNKNFSADTLRTGIWPYHINGVTTRGHIEKLHMKEASFYYGDPERFALNIGSNNVTYVSGENNYIKMKGATFRIGSYPFFYLPTYTHYFNRAPYDLSLRGGVDDERGAYLQTTTTIPIASWLRAGANLDFYMDRGILVGPTAEYIYDNKTHSLAGTISTGFINDNGNIGTDIYENSIDNERGFAEWRHKHHIRDRITLTSSINYWSDSEVTQDFRENFYNNNRQPDNFLEGVYAGDNYLISTFIRFQPNDFYLTQQHLPEVRFDLLPAPVFKTGAYHKASISYARLEEDFQASLQNLKPSINPTHSSYDRIDFTYRIERPVQLTDWMTWIPLAGARLTHYKDQKIDPELPSIFSPQVADEIFEREMFELGFDLEARIHATYPIINQTWKIDGLRHIVRPILRYRYHSIPDTAGEIAEIERTTFDLNRSILDLGELRNGDDISEQHIIRVGIEQLYQTRIEEGYGSRTLAALNFYQDILLQPEEQINFDGTKPNTLHSTWVELILEPMPWLKFDLAARFETRSISLEEFRMRTAIKSGEIWSIGLSTDILDKQIDQYGLDFLYRINERHSFFTNTRFDAEKAKFTKTQLGMHTRTGSPWQLTYAVNFRNDANRESEFEFTLKLKLIER